MTQRRCSEYSVQGIIFEEIPDRSCILVEGLGATGSAFIFIPSEWMTSCSAVPSELCTVSEIRHLGGSYTIPETSLHEGTE